MREVGERAQLGKVQDRTEAALTVFDNKDSECILKAQTTACHLSINVLVLTEHLPGEWVVPLLYIKDALYSHNDLQPQKNTTNIY